MKKMKTWMNKKMIGGVLLGVMFLLIFFSKTLYTWQLPEVTAVKPHNGKLSKVEVGYGTVQWAVVDSIYIPEEGTVGEIYVREGEYVEAGQKLFSMEYDNDENEWKLQEIENNRKILQTELREIENKLELARQYFDAAKKLYEFDDISTMDFNEARKEAQSLELESEEKRLEIEKLAILEEPYKKTQAIQHTEMVITAPSDGMLISSHISRGKKVSKDSLAITIGTGNEYILECPVSLTNNFVITGDSCSLRNSSHQVKGVITSVLPLEQQKIVSIRFTADQVTAGETFEVLFQKQSETSYILVPNAAVCQDGNGYYLKQLKRRDGIMGKEYYLERIDVYIGDSDSNHTAIASGVTFFEPVVLSSNKTAVTKDVVLLKNAGDFFEE